MIISRWWKIKLNWMAAVTISMTAHFWPRERLGRRNFPSIQQGEEFGVGTWQKWWAGEAVMSWICDMAKILSLDELTAAESLATWNPLIYLCSLSVCRKHNWNKLLSHKWLNMTFLSTNTYSSTEGKMWNNQIRSTCCGNTLTYFRKNIWCR